MIIGILLTVVVVRQMLVKYTSGDTHKQREISFGEWLKLIGVVILMLSGVALSVISFTSVDIGFVCVIEDPVFAKDVIGVEVGPSWFFRAPWTKVTNIYYATSTTEMWTNVEENKTGEFPAIHVLSQDGLDIEVDISIRSMLDTDNVVELYKSFPMLNWEASAITSIVREDVRDVIADYTAIEVIEKRETVSVHMTQVIYQSLISAPSLRQAILAGSIEIDLRDLDPPPGFKLSIENKLRAEQEKIQASFERERLLIQADAEAQQRLILANAVRESIDLVGEQNWQLFYSLQQMKELAPHIKTLIMTTGSSGIPIYFQLPLNSTGPY
jgi:regulator of protease activity HflC (stomatin/prohibitin superfamily)